MSARALSLLVLVIIAVTKFTRGAWFIIIFVPVMVALLVRLNRQYEDEVEELERRRARGRAGADPAPARGRRARRPPRRRRGRARSSTRVRCTPTTSAPSTSTSTRSRPKTSSRAWQNLGFSRLPLDVVECPDRRIPRAAAELVATALADGETEVSVLVPRRQYTHVWHRLLHDRTADAITEALAGTAAQQRHDRAVPPRDPRRTRSRGCRASGDERQSQRHGDGDGAARRRHDRGRRRHVRPGASPVAEARAPQARARVTGRVHSVRVQPHGGVASLECTLVDETGGIVLVFLGRRSIPGMGSAQVSSSKGWSVRTACGS